MFRDWEVWQRVSAVLAIFIFLTGINSLPQIVQWASGFRLPPAPNKIEINIPTIPLIGAGIAPLSTATSVPDSASPVTTVSLNQVNASGVYGTALLRQIGDNSISVSLDVMNERGQSIGGLEIYRGDCAHGAIFDPFTLRTQLHNSDQLRLAAGSEHIVWLQALFTQSPASYVISLGTAGRTGMVACGGVGS